MSQSVSSAISDFEDLLGESKKKLESLTKNKKILQEKKKTITQNNDNLKQKYEKISIEQHQSVFILEQEKIKNQHNDQITQMTDNYKNLNDKLDFFDYYQKKDIIEKIERYKHRLNQLNMEKGINNNILIKYNKELEDLTNINLNIKFNSIDKKNKINEILEQLNENNFSDLLKIYNNKNNDNIDLDFINQNDVYAKLDNIKKLLNTPNLKFLRFLQYDYNKIYNIVKNNPDIIKKINTLKEMIKDKNLLDTDIKNNIKTLHSIEFGISATKKEIKKNELQIRNIPNEDTILNDAYNTIIETLNQQNKDLLDNNNKSYQKKINKDTNKKLITNENYKINALQEKLLDQKIKHFNTIISQIKKNIGIIENAISKLNKVKRKKYNARVNIDTSKIKRNWSSNKTNINTMEKKLSNCDDIYDQTNMITILSTLNISDIIQNGDISMPNITDSFISNIQIDSFNMHDISSSIADISSSISTDFSSFSDTSSSFSDTSSSSYVSCGASCSSPSCSSPSCSSGF